MKTVTLELSDEVVENLFSWFEVMNAFGTQYSKSDQILAYILRAVKEEANVVTVRKVKEDAERIQEEGESVGDGKGSALEAGG